MNYKTLLLLPAALALGAPLPASAYVGLRLNFAVPLYYPYPAYYYGAPVYAAPVSYAETPGTPQEQVTPSPGPGYVWMAGHWNNVSQRWVWVAGHWVLPPSPSAAWVAGHWVQGSSGWVWVDGNWIVGAPSQHEGPPVAPSTPANASAQEPPAQNAAAAVAPPPTPQTADGTVISYEPPAPIAEVIPVAPYPDDVWIGGYWGWNGAWVWNAGHFARRPFRGAVWVGGGWSHVGGRWAWHGGRWR